MHRISFLFVLCALIFSALSASPPSFCKCTCFTDSKIIPLGPGPSSSSDDPAPANLVLAARARKGGSSCNQCDRDFCVEQRLPICADAKEKDIFTTCFQRDSRKDQIIVLLFIAVTVGLLAWAGVKKILERRAGGVISPEALGQYAPVGEGRT